MLGASIIRHLRQAAARFVGANGGNVAVIFTIAAIPVIGFVGAAIDYTRMNEARSTMQSALNSTALMLQGYIVGEDHGLPGQHHGTVLFPRAFQSAQCDRPHLQRHL